MAAAAVAASAGSHQLAELQPADRRPLQQDSHGFFLPRLVLFLRPRKVVLTAVGKRRRKRNH